MTISGTTILNMASVMPLFNIMMKEELTEENLASNLLSFVYTIRQISVPTHKVLYGMTQNRD
jgi:hypothetical protein